MQLIRFLLKFAFICNCCYLVVLILQMFNDDGHLNELSKGAAVLGILVALYVNIICLVGVLLLLVLRRVTWKSLPPWVFITNMIILLLQILV